MCVRLLALLDERGRLETVHVRHLHVEQDQREVLAQERAERLLARGRAHESLTQRLEHRLEREQVLLLVVDQQDARLVHQAATSAQLDQPRSDRVKRQDLGHAPGVDRVARHRRLHRGLGILGDRRPPASWIAHIPACRHVRSRSGEPPPPRHRYAVAADSKGTSIDGRLCWTTSSTGSSKRPGLDHQVVVGRRQVHPGRADPLTVVGVAHRQGAVARQHGPSRSSSPSSGARCCATTIGAGKSVVSAPSRSISA